MGRKLWVLLICYCVVGFGCASTQELQKQISVLKIKIAKQSTEIQGLNSEFLSCKDLSAKRLKMLNATQRETKNVKHTVRDAIRKQYKALTVLMDREELLDYVGSPLIKTDTFSGKSYCLIDPMKPVPAAGTLTGVWGYFAGPSKFRVLFMSPGGKKGEYMIYAQSQVFTVDEEGEKKLAFEAPFAVNQDDLIGYKFEGDINVYFNERTGSSKYLRELSGRKVKLSSLRGGDRKLSYSLRVVGMLDQ